MYQFINLQLLHYQCILGVVVITLASHVGGWGSIPHFNLNFVVFFVGIAQTLRAKITPFPRKDFRKNFIGHSYSIKHSFKPKKFTVGHFDLGRYVCLRNLDSVKKRSEFQKFIFSIIF